MDRTEAEEREVQAMQDELMPPTCGHSKENQPMTTDTKPSPLTAAELAEIGERIRTCQPILSTAEHDRTRLYAALVGLVDELVRYAPFKQEWRDTLHGPDFPTKDAAIDALLMQGGGE